MTSAAEREFHSECVAADIRADGRGREDLRPIELEAGVLPLASGSARVKLGRTDVIVGVKAEVSTPSDDKPDQGRLVCGVDCSPCAAVSFEGRSGDDQGKALAAALQRSFSVGPPGSGCGIDLKSLCIIPGRTCWVLYIDGLVLNHGGSLLDALSIAAKVALADMTIPSVEVLQDGADEVPEVEVDDDPAAGVRWDTGRIPVTLTVSLLNQHCIVDCTPSEEECVSAAVQVAVNAEGHVCGVSKTGTGSLGGGTLQEMLEIARNLAPTVIKSVDSFILSQTR